MMSGTGNKGFTLIEVMLAVTILAIGMVGVIRAYASMINTLEAADYSIEAICVLKESMFETARKSIEEDNLAGISEAGKIKGEYGSYSWSSTVTELDSSLEYDEATEEYNLNKGDLLMYLNRATVTVTNRDVTPVRRFTLVGYVDGWERYAPEE